MCVDMVHLILTLKCSEKSSLIFLLMLNALTEYCTKMAPNTSLAGSDNFYFGTPNCPTTLKKCVVAHNKYIKKTKCPGNRNNLVQENESKGMDL